MRDVVRKDLILNRNAMAVNLLIFSAAFALLSSMSEVPSREFTVLASVMVSFLPVMIVTREDKARAMALACSLPVTRRTIVRARYGLALVLATGGILLALGLAAWLPTSAMSATALFQPANLLTALSVALLVMSLMLPLTLRFGAMGLILLLAVSQVIGIVLFTVVQITESTADKALVAAVVRGIGDVAARLGTPGFHLLLAALLAGLVAASYRVSVFVFERREL